MGTTTTFMAQIHNTGIKEVTRCLNILAGINFLIEDKNGNLHNPNKVFFCADAEYKNDSYFDYLPYGQYSLRCPLNTAYDFVMTITEDVPYDNEHSVGDYICLCDFTKNSYDKNRDFILLKDLCKHMGYSSYDITKYNDEIEEHEEYIDSSIVYFREIDVHCEYIVNQISKILFDKGDLINTDEYEFAIEEVDNVFNYAMEEREKEKSDNPFLDENYSFLRDRAIIKGFILSGMEKDEYIKACGKDLIREFESVFKKYEEYKENYDNTIEEDRLL